MLAELIAVQGIGRLNRKEEGAHAVLPPYYVSHAPYFDRGKYIIGNKAGHGCREMQRSEWGGEMHADHSMEWSASRCEIVMGRLNPAR
jgi:hypothetical protein